MCKRQYHMEELVTYSIHGLHQNNIHTGELFTTVSAHCLPDVFEAIYINVTSWI